MKEPTLWHDDPTQSWLDEPTMPGGPITVTVEASFGTITLTLDQDKDHNLADVAGVLLRPALLAAGYHPNSVNRYVADVYG